MKRHKRLLQIAAAALAVAAGCKGAFEITNPGPILDALLDTPETVPGFVLGMSGDLSAILDEIVRISGVASDDIWHGGSYAGEGLWVRGIINEEDVNTQWAGMQRARWVAEHGIERIKAIPGYTTYNTDSVAARANLLAGFANRLLGENVCSTTIDGGPEQPNTVHFSRAETYFTEALRIAQSKPFPTLVRAAYAGRASVRAWQGKWAEAVADAAQVPDNFSYVAFYSTNSTRERNELVFETYSRREYTVYNTQWAQVFNDPRVPWDTIYTNSSRTAIQKGQDGKTNYFRQKKYPDQGSDIPLVKGAEMLMLRAEERLLNGDIPGAFTFINRQRALYTGLTALAVPTDINVAWTTLEKERGAVTWLEARRLWDLRRWNAQTGPGHNTFLDGRAKCIPISREERQANPNL
jgi:starch-binding outer membrane protein, SusD/RagB family